MPLSNHADVNWDHDGWNPWRVYTEPLLNDYRQKTPYDGLVADLLNQHKPNNLALQFALQDTLDTGIAYEHYIYENKICPTRDGWHDFFNALCWFLFPQSKSCLNLRQYQQISQDGILNKRGPVRDAITLFDESGFLLQCDDALWQALESKQWHKAFIDLRPLWDEAVFMIFGHAILEKFLKPYPSICAHALRIPNDVKLHSSFSKSDLCPLIDTYLANALTPNLLATKPFIPLPLMGIPGWDALNHNPSYYENDKVFRKPR